MNNDHINQANKQKFRIIVLFIIAMFLGIFLYKTFIFIKQNDISMHKTEQCTNVKGDVWLISYADGNDIHLMNQNALSASALNNCIDHISLYRKKHLDSEFTEKNKHILNQSRGVGYWLWKPYLIMETLKKIPENDIVVYVDTGIKIRNNISDLLNNLAQKDIVLFGSMFKIRSYTKRDLLRFLNMDNAETLNSQQIQGGIIIVRNTKYSRQFINKWLELSQNEQLITDIPSENEYPDFIDHRHDQSIISLLALQNQQNIIFVPFEEKHRYFYHHRRRNTNFIPLVIDGTLLIEKNIDPKKPLSFWDNMIYQTLLMIN
jgi:hypothetical protein